MEKVLAYIDAKHRRFPRLVTMRHDLSSFADAPVWAGRSGRTIPLMVTPDAKREGVAHVQAVMSLSERRACSIVNADRTMIRYRSCRRPDTELRRLLCDLANARRRFGYRRLFVLLRNGGEPSGINRIYRF